MSNGKTQTTPAPQPEGSAEERTIRRTTLAVSALTGAGLTLIVLFFFAISSKISSANADILTRWYMASAIAILGAVTLGAVFIKMRPGIRQQNLRAVGIVLIVVVASLLAVAGSNYDPVFGILGAVAGYLFGKDKAAENEENG